MCSRRAAAGSGVLTSTSRTGIYLPVTVPTGRPSSTSYGPDDAQLPDFAVVRVFSNSMTQPQLLRGSPSRQRDHSDPPPPRLLPSAFSLPAIRRHSQNFPQTNQPSSLSQQSPRPTADSTTHFVGQVCLPTTIDHHRPPPTTIVIAATIFKTHPSKQCAAPQLSTTSLPQNTMLTANQAHNAHTHLNKYLSVYREHALVLSATSLTKGEISDEPLSALSSRDASAPRSPRSTRSNRRVQALPSPRRRSVVTDAANGRDADGATTASISISVLDAVRALPVYVSLLERQAVAFSSPPSVGSTVDTAYLLYDAQESHTRSSSRNKEDPLLHQDSTSQCRRRHVTFAQHGEQLRMRGIQPSRRTNEIHMHIAPRMDTSVKYVIAC